jgi:ATP-binding cassette subfamily C protein
MLRVTRNALGFMEKKERLVFFTFLSFRAFTALLDLTGILSIGFLATSMALLFTEGLDPNRQIDIGSIVLPAVTAESLPVAAFVILTLFVAKAALSILLTRQLANFLAKIEARSARVIASNAFGKGIEGARHHTREEILYAVQIGSPSAFNAVLNSVGTLSAEGFLFLLVIGAFLFVNPAIALGAILYFGLIGLIIQLFVGRLMQRTGVKLTESIVEANSGLADLGEVIREVAILGRQNYFYDRIYKARLRTSGSAATQYVLTGMPRYIVETALIIAISIFIILQASTGEIASSAATVGIFLSGGLRLTSSLLPLQSALLIIKQAIPPATRALDLLSQDSNEEPNGQTQTPSPIIDYPVSVSIEKLSFIYEGSTNEVLNNINLDISAGEQAAFVGVSGSGKSTLADIILGLIDPSSGKVLVDGINPSVLIKSRPGLLGYVPQKPGMISGTIAQNIALGCETNEIDQVKLKNAIASANLKDFIDSLPRGLETDIGKRKDELSGGQLQRIGLARALYSEPKLLVMDEATSSLDAESENQINIALDSMRGKVTIILIAHRLNTVQRSNKVFLVEKGKISATGSFQDLLKTNAVLRNLAELMAINPV